MNVYLFMLGLLILVGGSFGDIFGERWVFSIGVGGFGVVLVLCVFVLMIEVLIVGCAL